MLISSVCVGARIHAHVCVVCLGGCVVYCLLGDMFMVTTIFKVLFVEMYANIVFVISCLYSAVSLTPDLVRE